MSTLLIDGLTVGKRIRQARRLRDVDQAELARAVGKSREAVSLWERDKGTPSVETLIDIARRLEIPVTAFVVGLDEPTDPDGGSRNPNVTIRNLKVISGSKPKRLVPTNQSDLEDAA